MYRGETLPQGEAIACNAAPRLSLIGVARLSNAKPCGIRLSAVYALSVVRIPSLVLIFSAERLP
jgi:hypothetical protein